MYKECTILELKAYRDLQGEPFDFGDGLIVPNCYGEDLYYKQAIENFSFKTVIEHNEVSEQEKYLISKERRRKLYKSKVVKEPRRLAKLLEQSSGVSNDGKEYLAIGDKGDKTMFYKKASNKAVRRYKGKISNGGSYKKCYDYDQKIS